MALTPPYQPVEVTNLEMAFGARVHHLMPAYGSVKPDPDWRALQQRWFFSGLPAETQMMPKEGVDPKLALRHLRTIQGSFAPKHEHKEEAVAFLLGEWFEFVVTPDRTYGTRVAA
ncbi:hypothetical protein [Cellulosimicrobium funkei]|uniref:hypothetical protein n=1 Tax=Cellulosimicrobium funkei TaxID=264251 RepID=UPI0036BF63C7